MEAPAQSLPDALVFRFKELPVVRKLQERSAFAVSVTVETSKGVDFDQACRWAFATADDGKGLNLQGRVRPRLLFPEAEHVLWDFEFDDDGLLFLARFGGTAHRSIDIDQWRKRVMLEIKRAGS